jgi:hypothetical protein
MITALIITALIGLYLGIAILWAVYSLPLVLISEGSLTRMVLRSLLWPIQLFRILFCEVKL